MKYLILTIMLAMSTVNAGENVASAIDEYIDDNPEVVLPILVGGGVSTAGVILTLVSVRSFFKHIIQKSHQLL
jgi:hypothetical protein